MSGSTIINAYLFKEKYHMVGVGKHIEKRYLCRAVLFGEHGETRKYLEADWTR